MKITGQNPYNRRKVEGSRGEEVSRSGAAKSEEGKGAERGQRAQGPGNARAAEVRMSAQAQAMRDMRAPERPDASRVERLRQLVDAGELTIDPERIAQVMLEEER